MLTSRFTNAALKSRIRACPTITILMKVLVVLVHEGGIEWYASLNHTTLQSVQPYIHLYNVFQQDLMSAKTETWTAIVVWIIKWKCYARNSTYGRNPSKTSLSISLVFEDFLHWREILSTLSSDLLYSHCRRKTEETNQRNCSQCRVCDRVSYCQGAHRRRVSHSESCSLDWSDRLPTVALEGAQLPEIWAMRQLLHVESKGLWRLGMHR